MTTTSWPKSTQIYFHTALGFRNPKWFSLGCWQNWDPLGAPWESPLPGLFHLLEATTFHDSWSSVLKASAGPCGYTGPMWIIQNNLLISRSVD
jgi:hypothetical protein